MTTSLEVEAVIAAALAVQNYRVEKAWKLLPGLRAAGLTDPASVAVDDVEALTAKLVAAGYDRGKLTGMIAGRFRRLMEQINAGGLDGIAEAVRNEDRDGVIAILTELHGIGPSAATSAWMLLSS